MGLTGVILDATFDLIPVETSLISVDEERCSDLDHLMASMSERDDRFRYSVAWIDCTARGRSMGRGILGPRRPRDARRGPEGEARVGPPIRADTARDRAADDADRAHQPADDARVQRGLVPQGAQAPRRHPVDLGVLPPLDLVDGWNRVYGRRGCIQYQYVVPFGAEATVRYSLEELSGTRHAVVPRGAEAPRCAEPGDAVVPDAGLDARGRHPGRQPRAPAPARPARRRRARGRRPRVPGQGRPHPARAPRRHVSAPAPVARDPCQARSRPRDHLGHGAPPRASTTPIPERDVSERSGGA